MTPTIITATLDQIEDLVPLFDAYRVFYKQQSDPEAARTFLSQRLYLGESMIFLAYHEGRPVGFTQLYPLFSSTSMKRIWLLNDLYVVPDLRGQRIGEQLIQRAADVMRSFGAVRLKLSTQNTNLSGQKLYERVGFVRDTDFYYYNLDL